MSLALTEPVPGFHCFRQSNAEPLIPNTCPSISVVNVKKLNRKLLVSYLSKTTVQIYPHQQVPPSRGKSGARKLSHQCLCGPHRNAPHPRRFSSSPNIIITTSKLLSQHDFFDSHRLGNCHHRSILSLPRQWEIQASTPCGRWRPPLRKCTTIATRRPRSRHRSQTMGRKIRRNVSTLLPFSFPRILT